MEAGRELDALIAEKVMGHRMFEPPPMSEPWEVMPDDYRGRPLLPYSTDIGAAWEVVEKMRERGKDRKDIAICMDGFSLSQNHVGEDWQDYPWAPEGGWSATFTDGYNTSGAAALTAPHAICLAALKAVE